MNLREQVELLLPNWSSWYPSLFDAAVDLGILRARVCDPATLLLQRRHEGVRAAAAQAHREQWNVESDGQGHAQGDEEDGDEDEPESASDSGLN